MTGLEKITQEIQQAAQSEADEIIRKAEEEAREILEKSNASVKSRTTAIIAQAKNTAKDTTLRTSSSVELQHRQDVLQVKQRLLKDTLSKAKDAVATLPQHDYLALLVALAKSTDLKGTATISVRENDQPLITSEFLANFPKELTVTLDPQPAAILGGFLLKSGNVLANSSIEAIFDRHQDAFTDKILEILFD